MLGPPGALETVVNGNNNSKLHGEDASVWQGLDRSIGGSWFGQGGVEWLTETGTVC